MSSAQVDPATLMDAPGVNRKRILGDDSGYVDPSKLSHGAGVGKFGLGGLG